ncbi:DNA primase subunit [Synechococcus phage ACG-2014d]|uniref:DNA primase subunit n=3 Tax=Synechococcus phage ACG-2014d TaxID=1493509 RepID=A0A0E3FEZ5_9CAUD|nr:DNA primase subunit [Synechococcus phage ACG-2014d]
MAFGLGKLNTLEAKLDIYEDLSKEMLDKLERAVDRISENSNRVAIMLERHENRLDESDRTHDTLMKLLSKVEQKIDDVENKVGEIQKFRWVTVGIAVAVATVFQLSTPLSRLTPSDPAAIVGRCRMNYIETKYVNLLSSRLDKFARKKEGLWNFRCPYCGDSKKYKNKARGYFIRVKTDLVFKCHNCGVGRSFSNFLKDNCIDLHDDYVMERYKEGLTGAGRYIKSPELDFKTRTIKRVKMPTGLTPISCLNNHHPAKGYLLGRGIPEKFYDKLFYVEKFQEWVNKQKPTYSNTKFEHPRIIIPLIQDGSWTGFQGRSLDSKDKMRYITIILDDSKPKIFGLDDTDKDSTIYITEGPFDSLFIDNSIAMVGADIDWSFCSDRNVVFVYDNEPRNAEIIARMVKVIDRGYKIVIWPDVVEEKDINEMINAGHNVLDLVESNIHQGLSATLTLNNWKRV